MIRNWLNIYLYNLKQNKLFSALNDLGLSIGIAGLIFAILYWNDEHEYNKWNPEKEIVYQVVKKVNGAYFQTISNPVGDVVKTSLPEVESYCYFDEYGNGIIRYNEKEIYTDRILDAQSNFFSFFPFPFIKGNAQSALRDQNSVSISEELAQNLFKEEDPLGKQIKIFDDIYIVHGVYKIHEKSSIRPSLVIRNRMDEVLVEDKSEWNRSYIQLLLKVQDKSKLGHIGRFLEESHYRNQLLPNAKKEGITPEMFVEKYGKVDIVLEPLHSARLYSKVDGYPEGRGNLELVIIIMGLSILILVLSIVNYVNLATANATRRAKEVGVRKVAGATKRMIVLQFIFETFLATLFAVLIALVIVELSLPFYNDFLQKSLLLDNSHFFSQLVVVFIVVMLLAGLLPAIYVANFTAINVLKGNFSRSKKGTWIRNGMLVFQFTIASFFIIAAGVVHNQVNYMINKDLGFNRDQLLDIRLFEWQDFDEYQTLKNEIKKIKGVKEVSSGMFSFGEGGYSFTTILHKDAVIDAAVDMPIDFGMLKMLGVKMSDGRSLSPKYSSDTVNSVLINRKAYSLLRDTTLLGNDIEWKAKKVKVVGIVEDFNISSPRNEIMPMVFYHMKTVPEYAQVSDFFVKISPEDMEETIAAIEYFWKKKVTSKYPFDYDFVDKKFARTYASYTKQKNVFSFLNFVVLLIALFGLFALASFSIQRRMKGIVVRKVLGAETNALLKELSKQYILFCVLGFVLALMPAYFMLQHWLDNFAYRISMPVVPFITCFLVIMTLTLVVVLTRAYRATRVDVLKYLKYE